MFSKLWQWFNGRISIRKRLVISYMVLVSIPILILGIYSFHQANDNLFEQTEETMRNNLSRLVLEMENRFQREQDFMKLQAYNVELRSGLKKYQYDNENIARLLTESVEPVLWYFITSDENIKMVKIITPYCSTSIGKFLKPADLYENEEWYQKHKENFKTLWRVEDGCLYASRTILDADGSSYLVGVMETEFYLNRFIEPIISMNYLGNGICVTDSNGNTIYARSVKDDQVEAAVRKQIQKTEPGQAVSNDKYILKSAVIDSAGWIIYYYVDKGMISEKVSHIIISTLTAVMVCIVLTVLLISLLSKIISRRILTLKAYAERVAGGDLENPCYTNDTDEIGIVMNSLGKMTERLNATINQVYKIEIEKKEAELQALQAMINPHFLYNCLSSIKWKAIRKGDDEISRITGLIARFYRTALNNGQQITTVGSELDNIKAYVEIQQETHDHSFDVEYEIDEEGLECKMLNFLLQPIVENAIKHGIDYKEEESGKGKVRIVFEQKDEFLIFRIYNNGLEMEMERLDDILSNRQTGYGLFNIRERIALYYGDGCGVSGEVTEEGETCFTVKILSEVTKKQQLH